ncbi:MAG TPA: iron uptake protein [Methylibium sp.]|uniref:iron uptake protein n=1 Tax=Methylibium sp. TaxID=2067992 RepID=UPI002DB5EB2C|nr:iron uptake protein [Methylibium sp.]HEU4460766.1 iron uptake protein [Methylibium sp.]
MPSTATPNRLQIASRVGASLLGGWAFVWGFTTLAITGLVKFGQTYKEASTAAMLLAFVVFLVAFCWAFAAASVARVWAVLAGGAALMTGAAWLLQRSLL